MKNNYPLKIWSLTGINQETFKIVELAESSFFKLYPVNKYAPALRNNTLQPNYYKTNAYSFIPNNIAEQRESIK